MTDGKVAAAFGPIEREQLISSRRRAALRVAQTISCPWYMDRDDLDGAALVALVEAVDRFGEAPQGVNLDAWIGRRVRRAVMRERTMHRRWREGLHVERFGVDFKGRVWRHPSWRGRRRRAVPRHMQPRFSSDDIKRVWGDNPHLSAKGVADIIGCSRNLVTLRDRREKLRPVVAA